MRSSMVLTTSGKPCRKSAASCLAASACSAAKSSCAASSSPVWFQSSSCSLRTRSLFSCADIGISLPGSLPDGPQHSVHDATRRYPVHPGVFPNREAREEAEAGRGGLLLFVLLRHQNPYRISTVTLPPRNSRPRPPLGGTC